ncbi:unnamed protein product, partial [marine sediment metagenome]
MVPSFVDTFAPISFIAWIKPLISGILVALIVFDSMGITFSGIAITPFSAFHDGISLDQTGTAMGAVAIDINFRELY